ncbi:MAG TPA: EF-Tu/IF-2/RF-3 family GTPase, partial [Candidatus Paceibacterota bacterium]
SNEQADFKVVYTIGKQGIAKIKLEDESKDLTPLLDTILAHVPPASSDEALQKPARLQPFNLGYDNFLGRLAVARVYEGVLHTNDPVFVKKSTGETRPGKITKMYTFKGLQKVEVNEVSAGDIVLVAGLSDIFIGETITTDTSVEPLPAIAIDEPTITLNFLVNNSPFAGREGKFVTSRQIRERLERELEVNVGLRVEFVGDNYKVSGRGELHIAILLENMRREGYELQVSQPQVIFHEENGQKLEPYEEVVVDTPAEYQGAIIERLGTRKFVMSAMGGSASGGKDTGLTRMIFTGPTRGLLGYRNQFVLDTKGEGILSSRVIGFRAYAGEIKKRQVGSMISMASGKALGFSLWNLQDRGVLYIAPAVEVYEGLVIGNTSKGEEMMVNPTKGKQLTNMRSKGTDEALNLIPPFELSIERGLEVMAEDEYLEITPSSVRLRKQFLTEIERSKARR